MAHADADPDRMRAPKVSETDSGTPAPVRTAVQSGQVTKMELLLGLWEETLEKLVRLRKVAASLHGCRLMPPRQAGRA